MKYEQRPVRHPRSISSLAGRGVLAALLLAGIVPCTPVLAQQATQAAAAATGTVFAKVGDKVIGAEQYEAAFAQAARNKFYHGKPPEAEVARLQREVGQKLVDDILLAAEAKRRNIQPDPEAVQKIIAGYDKRYEGSPQWKANRERVLPGLTAKLQEDNVMEQLTAQVKKLPEPTDEQLQQYYDQHRDKFTSPEQVHVGIILLRVDPSSPKDRWDSARAEAEAIVKRLQGGADFSELARLHSNEESAQRGGDLGFVHRGVLPEVAQKVLDAMQPGAISEPVRLLEGVAVLRLQDRKPAVLNSMERVRPRLRDLYLRDKGEEAWTALLVQLRNQTPVQMDESRFLPLAASTGENNPAR